MISVQAKMIPKLKLVRVQIELDGSDFFQKPPVEMRKLLGAAAYKKIQEAIYADDHGRTNSTL